MHNFDRFIASLNSDNSKGLQFEIFVKWFLKNDPEWATQVDEVWMWGEYPDRWGPDCGIDLVFKHKNGETWAVQAKCYDTKYSISKKDVDTFLSESNRQGIDKRLLIASTDQVGRNARQVCQAQEKPVVLYLYADFDKAAIDYPSDMSQLSSAKRKELPTPRLHQTKAIEDVIQGFETDDRGQMIMACGTGKTYTTLWVKEALNAKTTLVLLPSLSLLSQTLREWASASSKPFEALCVCSDETVGKQSNDELISSVQDVAFPTTSDPQVIKSFLDRDVSKVVFSTYHSSPSIAEAQSDSLAQLFDLVIADEAHRCTGEAGKAFTTILDDSLIKAKKRLFTTATPRTYSTNIKKKASEMGVDIADMSDEASFGKEFHNLTFAQAIDKKLLTDYRVVIIGVDEPMISKWIENRELVRTDDGEATDAKTLASQIGLIKAIKDYDLKRMISFHSRVKSAEWFAEDLHNVIDFVSDEHRPEGEIYTDFVSGEMSSYDRGLKLSQLKKLNNADRGLLTNARCLSEGVDVPSLDGVAFIDPRSSQVDIVQAVGRAIRKSDNKTIGTIVLPVFIGDTDNVEESLQSSNFKPIWGVLNALKSHDETLSLELDQLRTNLGRQGGGSVGRLPDKVIFDLPKTISGRFSDALRTITVDKITTTWEFWYGLLCNYIEKNQSIETSDKCIVNGLNLGSWITTQRALYNKNEILPNRRKQLDDLGFIWDAIEYKWNKGYELLKQYINTNGDTLVSRRRFVGDFNLGSWVGYQRSLKLSGELAYEKESRLEEINFVWDPIEYKWSKGCHLLKQYIEENGDALVPALYKVNDFKLGGWVSHRRRERNDNILSSEKIQELDELGFIWDIKGFQWHEGLDYLKQYIKDFGDAAVPAGYRFKGYGLGSWVTAQRQIKSKGNLSSDRISKLNDLNFIWSAKDLQWHKNYEYLIRYFERNGNTLISLNYETEDGFRLGKWVAKNRTDKNLNPEKVQKLNDLDFIWNALDLKWTEGYDHLKSYVEINGNANVPNDYVTNKGFKLGGWVSKQRQNSNKMSLDRREKLNDLNFIWDARELRWSQGYEHLKQYFEDNGNTLVSRAYTSSNGYKLGSWVGNLRQHKNRMTEEQVQKLNDLGFVWNAKE